MKHKVPKLPILFGIWSITQLSAIPQYPVSGNSNSAHATHQASHKEFHDRPQRKTPHKNHDRATDVPAIARLLAVRVGYSGQEVLEKQFGKGHAVVGGHPGGGKVWRTRHPSGYIATDGFNYNNEGLALESLSWMLDPSTDPKTPLVPHLPHHPGWLGVVEPGMSEKDVSRLTAHILSAPQKSGDTWIWKSKGFVRPSPANDDVYTLWTAKLSFHNRRLMSIEVSCTGRGNGEVRGNGQ